jgi:hypothetical protein
MRLRTARQAISSGRGTSAPEAVRQRGNALLVALIALTGLISLAGLTVMSVQGGIATSGADRFKTIALYAAESGAASTMDYLRKNIVFEAGQGHWPDSYVSASNASPPILLEIPGNQKLPGDPSNLLSPSMNAWFEVELLNDHGDLGYTGGTESNGRIIIRSTGHGPDGATAIVEWDVSAAGANAFAKPCPSYGQKGMAEDGAGRNDCLSTIDSTQTATFTPGGP